MASATLIPDLRPLSLGELLDRTFALYREHFSLFVGIMAIPSVLSIPFTSVFLFMQGSATFRGFGAGPGNQIPVGAIAVAIAFLLLSWIVYAMSIGAATYAVSEAYLGQKATVRRSYGRIRGKFMKILGVFVVALLRGMGMFVIVAAGIGILFAAAVGATTAIAGHGQRPEPALAAIVGISLVLCYLVGIGLWILWFLRYAVSIPALLLENLKVLPALRRSVQLTRGRLWQMLVGVALCGIIAYTGVIVFQGPFLIAMMFSNRGGHIPEWLAFTFAASGAIGGAITGPLLLVVLVVYYYDTRIRKEAFDLQFMMSSLDTPVSVPGTTLPG